MFLKKSPLNQWWIWIWCSSAVLLLSGCLAVEPTPDPTQALVPLSEVQEVEGVRTTNVVLQDTAGLGLRLDTAEEVGAPAVLENNKNTLFAGIRIISHEWGDRVRAGDTLSWETEGAEHMSLRILFNGALLATQGTSAAIPPLAPTGKQIVDGVLLNDHGIVDIWRVILGEGANDVVLADPFIVIASPARGEVLQGPVSLLVHIHGLDILPGVYYWEYGVNGVSTPVYSLEPVVLNLDPGRYELTVVVKDVTGREVLGLSYDGPHVFEVID